MLKAGVVIDDWKLKIFKKIFDDAGFKYTEINGPSNGCITLLVETETIEKLQPFVYEAMQKSANQRNKRLN